MTPTSLVAVVTKLLKMVSVYFKEERICYKMAY